MAAKTAALLGLSYALLAGGHHVAKKQQARSRALSLVASRGMINLCSGCDRTAFSRDTCNLSEIIFNVDLTGGGPNYISINLEEPLPFADGQFDVAFASHCLEHLENWEQALDEWARIADYVIAVLPHPLSILGHLNPDHRQHFTPADIDYIRETWGAEVYY